MNQSEQWKRATKMADTLLIESDLDTHLIFEEEDAIPGEEYGIDWTGALVSSRSWCESCRPIVSSAFIFTYEQVIYQYSRYESADVEGDDTDCKYQSAVICPPRWETAAGVAQTRGTSPTRGHSSAAIRRRDPHCVLRLRGISLLHLQHKIQYVD